ncbi:phage tail domain-containing protein, partial [Staphylococcus aureus]
MQDTIQIDNKTIEWLVVQRGFEIPSFNFVTEKESVKGRAGSIAKARYLNDIEFDLPLIIQNEKLSPGGEKTHDDILEALVKFFNIKDLTPKKLKFKSQNWYWFAYFDGPLKLPKNPRGSVKFTIKVVLTDPYKYSVTGNKNTAISDQVSVVNNGTADTPLIVEARAIKPSSYFMITKNDEDY